MAYDYDLFVIGAGSGGVRASRIAAGYGARVGICEDYRVGGTCVIRGCVPKKLLVYGSKYAHEFEDSAAYGLVSLDPDGMPDIVNTPGSHVLFSGMTQTVCRAHGPSSVM